MRDRLRNRLEVGRQKQQDGFTLIELLIVIVILGILAGIVVFAVGGITDRGDKSACKSDYKTLQVAQEANFAQNKSYALTDAALVTAKFLAGESKYYNAGGAADGKSYAITKDTATTPNDCTVPPTD